MWEYGSCIGDDLYVLAHTYRDDVIRPISLRLAERSERKLYRKSWGHDPG